MLWIEIKRFCVLKEIPSGLFINMFKSLKVHCTKYIVHVYVIFIYNTISKMVFCYGLKKVLVDCSIKFAHWLVFV